MNTDTFDYSDIDELKKALIGRSIEKVESTDLGSYHGEVKLTLDNGDVLTAYEADGGCACSNGCFDLTPKLERSGTILNVEIDDPEGGNGDGFGQIKLFIYTELGKQEALVSEGGDNGYYGWGYALSLKTKES